VIRAGAGTLCVDSFSSQSSKMIKFMQIRAGKLEIKEYHTHVSFLQCRFLIPGIHIAGLSAAWIGDCHIAQRQSAEDI